MSLYFEDFTIGRVWRTAGRTVGEGDIATFAGLSGDFTPIHVDAHAAARGPFGARIAHGMLPMSMAIGQMTQLDLLAGTGLALLNVNWDFPGAVRIGDTVSATVTVLDTRPTRRADRGIIRLQFEVANQDAIVVQKGVNTILVLTRAGLAGAT